MHRYMPGATTVLGILPGSNNDDEKPKPHYIFQLVADEAKGLERHGVKVFDAVTKEPTDVRVFVLTTSSDYRGIEVMLNMTGAPRVPHGCYRCWLEGTAGPGKCLYNQAWRWKNNNNNSYARGCSASGVC